MEIFCSTIIRGSSDDELSGFFYHISWSEKRIIKKVQVPQSVKQFGSRGGSRGGRGLYHNGKGELFACTCDKILIYRDSDFKLLDVIEHPHLIGHHDLTPTDEGLWCNSTLIDAFIKIDWNGKVIDSWYASEDKEFLKLFNTQQESARYVRRPRNYNYMLNAENENSNTFQEQFHFNTVDFSNNTLHGFSNRRFALVKIHADKTTIIQRNPRWLWAHNVLLRQNKIYVNNSYHKKFEIYKLGAETPSISIKLDDTKGLCSQYADSGWIRGLEEIDSENILVGSSPARIFQINTSTGTIEEQMILSKNVNNTIHSIAIRKV